MTATRSAAATRGRLLRLAASAAVFAVVAAPAVAGGVQGGAAAKAGGAGPLAEVQEDERAPSTPDPAIVWDGEQYVMFTTQQSSANVPVFTSPDLETWAAGTDALPELPTWSTAGQTWSPFVRRTGDGSWMLYAATTDAASGAQCVLAATATDATGPFTPVDRPVVCEPERGGSIDPFVAEVDDTTILYWAAPGNGADRPAAIRAATLGADGTTLEGTGVDVLTTSAAWEEGALSSPTLIVADDGLAHLLYSGGQWGSESYALGSATCTATPGPCSRDGDGLATLDGVEEGSGIAGLKPFTSADGSTRAALHGPAGGLLAGNRRQLVLADVTAEGGAVQLQVDQ